TEVGNPLAPSKPELKSVLVAGCVIVRFGVSATGVTLTVIVFGVGSRSTPPLAVPPLSCTWKVNEASGEPLALAAGVNTSLPPLMSATLTEPPAVTATPLSGSLPVAAPGGLVILTPP